jgi:RNA polymerase sigma-70 factor (ECF subfamily)
MAGDDREPWIKDELLVHEVVQKGEKALQTLYCRYAPLLHHVAMKSLDKAAAEDIVQEVFFSVWTKAGDFDPSRGNFRNWILQIAHFRILNELRRRSRRPTLDFEDMDMLAESIGRQSDPPEETWKNFRVDALQEAIERLPKTQRQALRLAFFDELSHEEVADTLGIPLGTIKGRIRLALRDLRRRLLPVVFGILVAFGAGASALAYLSSRNAADDEGTLAFVTRSNIEVKKLAAIDGSVTGTCSYDTRQGTVILSLQGLKVPAKGVGYRLWARWDAGWIPVGAVKWRGEGKGLLHVTDTRWSREPAAVEVTEESSANSVAPSERVILESDL